MAFLTANYKNNQQGGNYDPLPQGIYEMVIKSAQETATPNGSESLQLDLVVRNDLDKVPELAETNAKYHNRHVFMDNWKRKSTHQYDMEGFQYILEGAQVPEGTVLNSVDDFIKWISGRPVRVFVKKIKDTYNGETKDKNQVAPWNIDKTKFTTMNHVFKDNNQPQGQPQAQQNSDPFAGNGQQIDISDDSLPF